MSTNALLDHDFGSESEDDNFNPAPADQSDNEDAVEPDAENGLDSGPDDNITKSHRRGANGLKKEGSEDNKDSADGGGSARPFSGPGLAEEDEADELNSQGVDDDEEEEDEEEDDDEEAVVSVFAPRLCPKIDLLIDGGRADPGRGHDELQGINTSTLKLK